MAYQGFERGAARNRARILAMLASGSMLAMGGAAFAQTPTATEPAASELDEVVVTARSRAESLQDVPLIVNVMNAEAIEAKNVKDVFDVSKLSPSFTYVATVRGQANVSMRGLSPNSLFPQKQGVSFFMDGVNIPGEVTSLNLQDLDQIEVLKGPQSTHFGRSTYAGAVNYITRVPEQNHPGGKLSAEYSSYDSYELMAMLNLPIVQDKLYATVSGRLFHRGGLYTERNYGMKVGEQESRNFSANFLLRPWDNTTLKVRYSHDKDDDGHQVSYTYYRQDMAQYDRVFPTNATYPVFTVTGAHPELLGASCGTGTLEGRCGDRNRERDFVYGILDHEFANGYSIDYSASYFEEYNDWAADVTNRWLGDPMLDDPAQVLNPTQNRTKSFSHQVRLNSPSESKLQWLVGLYYMADEYTTYTKYGRIILNPYQLQQGYPDVRVAPSQTENKAVYFSFSYPILERLTFTAEGRYQDERVFVDECDLTECQYYGAKMSRSSKDFLPRVTFDYKFSPDFMGYVLYSEGVKSAVLNTSTSVTTHAAALSYQEANYQSPEEVKNYEIGLKGSLFDRTLSFQAAAYHMDVTNQQVATFFVNSLGATSSITGNGGESNIDGVEVSGTWRPLRGLTFDGGLGYAHQEYTGGKATNSTLITLYGINSPKATLDGLTSTQTPKWTGNFSAEYSWPLASGDMSVRGDYTYVGRRYADIPNLIALKPVERTNLSARYRQDRYTFTVFVKNVFDVDEVFDASTGYGNVAEQKPHPRSGQSPSVIVNLPYPRTVGARFSYEF